MKRKWFHPVGGGARDDFVEEEEHAYTLKNSSNLDRGGKSYKSEREKHISGRVNSLVGLFQMKV